MGRKHIASVIGLLAFAAAGCNKGPEAGPQLPTGTHGTKAYVVCEGSLGNGNSALTLYLPEKDSVFEDVYKAANGQGLGDVFQSMTKIGNQYFLCVNNSDKIVVINKDSWKAEGLIGVNKPRYILPVSDEKAYVSALFSNSIYLIHPKTHMNYGQLILPYKNAEGMALAGQTAYIATWDTACSVLSTYNTAADQPGNPVTLPGRAPQEVLADQEGMLWVLAGNVVNGRQATLTRFDPASGTILKTYTFSGTADPMRPVFNPAKDTLYFIEVNYNGGSTDNGVFRMGIHDAALPGQPFVAAQGFQYFWALGIEPGTGHIYIGDPKGFIQRGTALIYNQQGALLKTFPTGIGPGHFFFDE